MKNIKTFKEKLGKEVMTLLYSDRIHTKNLSKDDRELRDFELIQTIVDARGYTEIGEFDILELATDFRRMFKANKEAVEILTTLGSKSTDEYYDIPDEISYFSREDDLNNLYLAKIRIEKLIEAIERNRPEYINFYTEE
ncbi:hypothetical protein JMA63_001289 [Staphylococcus pseudintermedius]|nr:hypothetical protein [Staphylococcus pseudintermedius]EHA6123910.1 hypothetical protein [Staphylococcus pseudintermedius]EIA4794105.1 hypothetical protein [Staphylococcus pseudintermedius]HAR5804769.1 hypothetical protein [Staphylococcus pseudintermedius]HAR5866914.1 hypothetical protein [Staphylococcus pseudintermedius]